MILKPGRTTWLCFNIALLAASVYLVNGFLNYKNYTLSESNWQSVKIKLNRNVMGAWATVFTKTALCKNQLNLGAWHGYQEFVYKNRIKAADISFSYNSNKNPFSFIIDKSDSLTRGIYFHYLNDTTGCFFIANNEGMFLSTHLFKLSESDEYSVEWNHARISLGVDSVSLSINGKHIADMHLQLPDSLQPGFRGSEEPVYVDDVMARDNEAKIVFSESFSPPFKPEGKAALFACFMVVFFFILALLRVSFAEISIINTLVFIAVAFTYWYYFNFTSGKYPVSSNDVNWHGLPEPYETEQVFCERLRKQYPVGKLAGVRKVIVFIGASQTWGSGVSRPDNTMPALVEKQLRNHFDDSTITIINCSIPGFTSKMLYPYYINEWSKYKPVLTVINLSTNESDSSIFMVYIRKFLEFDSAQHIKTMLIAEPNDFSSSWQLARHNLLHREGAAYGVKVTDVQAYLDTCNQSGFLWWDYVHMTDYGYRLFAEKISPDIIDFLAPYYETGEKHGTGK